MAVLPPREGTNPAAWTLIPIQRHRSRMVFPYSVPKLDRGRLRSCSHLFVGTPSDKAGQDS